jgi:hypothetical protein
MYMLAPAWGDAYKGFRQYYRRVLIASGIDMSAVDNLEMEESLFCKRNRGETEVSAAFVIYALLDMRILLAYI